MKKKQLFIIALALVICTFFSTFLAGCEASGIIDTANAEDLCKDFIDFVLADDYTSAYAMVDHFASETEFDGVWEYVRASLENSSSYELEAEGWQSSFVSGQGYVTYVTFKLESNDGKTCHVRLTSSDKDFKDYESIVGINFVDSTVFVERTKSFEAVNIVLLLFSGISFGFCIWMLVDCIKRKMKKKVLWSILIFLGGGFSLAFQNGQFLKSRLNISFLSMLSSIEIKPTSLYVGVAVVVPVGAIIYFFLRKKLTLPTCRCEDETYNTDFSESGAEEEIKDE